MSRNRMVYLMWSELLNLVGPARKWPNKIRKYFWTQNLGNKERFEVACFIYVNGVNPEVYFEWAKLIGNIHANNTKGWKDVRALFSKFDETESPVLGKYWAFDVVNNRYEYLNGITRYY